MENLITEIINDFERYFGVRIKFVLQENGKEGLCSISGNQYAIIWRSELRKDSAMRIVNTYSHQSVLVFSQKIYGPARDILKEAGINFMEEGGYGWLQDRDRQTYYRIRKNGYDQRINASRIEGDFGSRIRAAIKMKEQLLLLKVEDMAKFLRVSTSSIYYMFNQMKQVNQLVSLRGNKDKRLIGESYVLEEVFESLFKRGLNKLGKSYLNGKGLRPLKKLLREKGDQKECVFFDELRRENISLEIEKHLTEGRLIFKSPYNQKEFGELHEEFKKRFRIWYATTDIDLLCA